MEQEQYKNLEQQITPPTLYEECLKAFLVGGIICTIGHAITYFYIIFFDFTEKTVGNPTVSQ